ncbi:helix-turn-helix domain-containing protein [bacterium]|nr:helix-turn-helix domain-containing protein [bacterium]
MGRPPDQYAGLPMVSHCLNVFEIVCWSEKELTVSEIARKLDISKSTAHRVLQVMKEMGYVLQKPKGAYRPGPKVFALGSTVLRRDFSSDKIEPVMDDLSAATNETVLFAVAGGEFPGLLVVSERPTDRPIRLQPYIGKCVSEKAFGIALDDVNLATRAAMPVSDYTTSHDDKDIGVISSVVFDSKKNKLGVLAILAPKQRLDASVKKNYAELCSQKAAALGEALG